MLLPPTPFTTKDFIELNHLGVSVYGKQARLISQYLIEKGYRRRNARRNGKHPQPCWVLEKYTSVEDLKKALWPEGEQK